MKEIDIHIQEVQRALNKMNPKRPTPRHIIIKMPRLNTQTESLFGKRAIPAVMIYSHVISVRRDL